MSTEEKQLESSSDTVINAECNCVNNKKKAQGAADEVLDETQEETVSCNCLFKLTDKLCGLCKKT